MRESHVKGEDDYALRDRPRGFCDGRRARRDIGDTVMSSIQGLVAFIERTDAMNDETVDFWDRPEHRDPFPLVESLAFNDVEISGGWMAVTVVCGTLSRI